MAKVAAEKPLSLAIKERSATPSFADLPIHTADLEKIIRAGLEAPSGYNLQPWRFVVVRDREQKKKLRQAAFRQPKVEQASAVIVACGDPGGWKDGDLEEMLRMSASTAFTDQERGSPGGHRISWQRSGKGRRRGAILGHVGQPPYHDRSHHHDVDGGNAGL